MKVVRLGAALALTVALGACQNMGQKEMIGTAGGAASSARSSAMAAASWRPPRPACSSAA